MTMRSVITRFRAYQLGSPGSSFSFFADGHFTMLEGRLTELSNASLIHEMKLCNVTRADTLHITSWDNDHCAATELETLLALIKPVRIECPGYVPTTDNGKMCREIIDGYRALQKASNRTIEIQDVTPEYISSLIEAEKLAFRDTFYNPRAIDKDNSNDNSTIKFFRKGSFNVLSLGDVESQDISARLRRSSHLTDETDVMILAHHGADNGFTNKNLLKALNVPLAVCSSNYDNEYEHPRQEIRDLLKLYGVCLMTTKTGDVIVRSTGEHKGSFRAINLKAGSTEVSSYYDFTSKKARLLSYNQDTIRQLFGPHGSYPR